MTNTSALCKDGNLCARLPGRGRPALILTTSDAACHKSLRSRFFDTCPPRRVADLVHPDTSLGKQKYLRNPEKRKRRKKSLIV